jgi:hypothetical protein
MNVSHDHNEFGPQNPFLGSDGFFFAFLTRKSIFFLTLCKIPDRIYDHTDFGAQVPFLALKTYFRFFDPPKVYLFYFM